MQRKDCIVLGVALGLLGFLCFGPGMLDGFIGLTGKAPYLMSFVKFAILATFGECIGLRITAGVYNRPGFGLIPKALVWGVLGMGIKLAFTIFATGTPNALAELGLPVTAATLKTGSFAIRLLAAFTISLGLNFIFAPVFMTLHKITDIHIAETGGTLSGMFSSIDMGKVLGQLNWNVMWGFVFKKTLPMFWVPAHTITFMLPGYFQVVFAALLGIVLGVILAMAGKKKVSA